jgi:hypothetical protein
VICMDSYGYKEIQGRARGVLIEVADQLPSVTVGLVSELIDHNECGVALETLSEMLVESGAWISASVLSDISELVKQMGLGRVNADRLKARVRDGALPRS